MIGDRYRQDIAKEAEHWTRSGGWMFKHKAAMSN